MFGAMCCFYLHAGKNISQQGYLLTEIERGKRKEHGTNGLVSSADNDHGRRMK